MSRKNTFVALATTTALVVLGAASAAGSDHEQKNDFDPRTPVQPGRSQSGLPPGDFWQSPFRHEIFRLRQIAGWNVARATRLSS
jgi:hypothetical protein